MIRRFGSSTNPVQHSAKKNQKLKFLDCQLKPVALIGP
jgi:hypothetical protein